MSEAEVIKRVLTRAHPPAIMSLEDIADLIGQSYNYVRNTLQHQPDFPAKLERFAQPRWDRAVVLAWAGVQSN